MIARLSGSTQLAAKEREFPRLYAPSRRIAVHDVCDASCSYKDCRAKRVSARRSARPQPKPILQASARNGSAAADILYLYTGAAPDLIPRLLSGELPGAGTDRVRDFNTRSTQRR